MASVRSVSPGGALLRASRLFSLPQPIPPPPGNQANSGSNHNSDSATLAFPTHQVITTMSSSRKRGDWGLKRPLPLKSTTKSTNAMLRIRQIDSIEQVTDYSSGADHGLSLRKFQELNIPVTVPPAAVDSYSIRPASRMNLPQRSAFEEDGDFTAIDPQKAAAMQDKRWKFTGPWLAGMTQGAFNKWVAKNVKPRRPEFLQFLKNKIAQENLQTALLKAQENGETLPTTADPASVTDEQLTDYLRKLRNDNQQLYELVGQFLDLAPLNPPTSDALAQLNPTTHVTLTQSGSPYAERGPPITHPSAGLSYLKTSMYLDNHPLYGPQRSHPPVQARVMNPRRSTINVQARIGLAGFVTDSPYGDTASNSRGQGSRALDKFDPELVGGAKIWVQPHSASVDARGRIKLNVGDAKEEDRLVALELLGEEKIFGELKKVEAKPSAAADLRNTYRSNGAYKSTRMSSSDGYGVGTLQFRYRPSQPQ
ncbi:mitochondrial ribosomal protein MRP51 [Podospora appendiculata]|uniref:Mitochondrial ribosomal protein MRP51 n=1 Tax=Podospora appendiculata TaxID=314037 RepID=A0AAE0X818_9PEZI|nr:mitochondrial ribosomal protein MRP51 [Podospora appendiculata]